MVWPVKQLSKKEEEEDKRWIQPGRSHCVSNSIAYSNNVTALCNDMIQSFYTVIMLVDFVIKVYCKALMRFVIRWALALFNRLHINNLSQHLNIKQLFQLVWVNLTSSLPILFQPCHDQLFTFPKMKNNISNIFQGCDQAVTFLNNFPAPRCFPLALWLKCLSIFLLVINPLGGLRVCGVHSTEMLLLGLAPLPLTYTHWKIWRTATQVCSFVRGQVTTQNWYRYYRTVGTWAEKNKSPWWC